MSRKISSQSATVVICHSNGSELTRWSPGGVSVTFDVARKESRLEHLSYVIFGLKILAAFRDGKKLDLPANNL